MKKPTQSPETTLAKAVVPKPTKREIIAAMVLIQLPKEIEAWTEATAKRQAQEKALEADVLAYVRAQASTLKPSNVSLGHVYSGDRLTGVDVRFDILNPPRDLEKRLRVFHSKESKLSSFAPTAQDIAARITAQMSGFTNPGERVARLVNDAESRKALEEMLAAMNKPARPALTNG